MSEVHRYDVVEMLSDVGGRISYDPHGPEIVMASAYDAALSQLAALREELANTEEKRAIVSSAYRQLLGALGDSDMDHNKALGCVVNYKRRLADAERRNAELMKLIEIAKEWDGSWIPSEFYRRLDALTKPEEAKA